MRLLLRLQLGCAKCLIEIFGMEQNSKCLFSFIYSLFIKQIHRGQEMKANVCEAKCLNLSSLGNK